jgi:HicA toxin of bacterial toxin-antitoxin,
MNGKNVRTLKAVFREPASPSIAWQDIETLLRAAGCTDLEGSGSRVRFECRGIIALFHRPHPDKEAKRYQVRDAREFLIKIGVQP